MYEPIITADPHGSPNASRPLYLALLTFFVAIFSLSILLLYLYEVRPLSYFILMALLALILLLEILFVDMAGMRPLVILLQIMAYSLNLIWGVTMNYYLFVGRTDTLPHIWWAESLLKLGHVTDFFHVYQPFPLWHILCDSVYMLAGSAGPVYEILFINSGLVYGVLGIACLFLLVKKISGDERTALLSALFLSFDTIYIFYGMYSISRSIVMVLFVLLMVLLIDRESKAKRWLAYGLSFSLIVYHTVSILFIMAILMLTYVVQKVFIKTKENPIADLRFLAGLAAMTLVYWAVNASNIIWTITDSLLQSSAGAAGLQTGSIYNTPLSEVFNYAQYSLFILFILIGALLILRMKTADVKLKIFAVVALAMIPLSYPGPLLLVNTLSSTASIGRFEEYTFMFMVVTAAIGFGLLYKNKSRYVNAAIILLFVAMAFLSITNDFVASDNPLVKRPFYTYYLHESEVSGLNRLAGMAEGSLMTDYVAVRYLEKSPYMDKMHILEVDVLDDRLMIENDMDVIVVRNGELDERPIKLYTATGKYVKAASWNALDYYYREDAVFDSLEYRNRIYDSRSLRSYQ
jgi:hypothetical protein